MGIISNGCLPKKGGDTEQCGPTQAFNPSTRSCADSSAAPSIPRNTLQVVTMNESTTLTPAPQSVTLNYYETPGSTAKSCTVSMSNTSYLTTGAVCSGSVCALPCSCLGGVCTATFKGDTNWYGTTEFSYTVTDSLNQTSSPTQVMVNVLFVDVPPTAINLSVSVSENSLAGVIGQLSSVVVDNNNPSGILTYNFLSTPAHGTVSWVDASIGRFKYIPYTDYCNTPPPYDVFSYKVNDAFGGSATALVNVTVNCVNDPPLLTFLPNSSKTTVTENDQDKFRLAIQISPGSGSDESGQKIDISSLQYKTSNTSIILGNTAAFLPVFDVNGNNITPSNVLNVLSFTNNLLVLEITPVALTTGTVTLSLAGIKDNGAPAASAAQFDINLLKNLAQRFPLCF